MYSLVARQFRRTFIAFQFILCAIATISVLSTPARAAGFKPLYTFQGTPDGAVPGGALLQGSDGNFYGTTYQGGQYGQGSVFQVTPSGTEKVIYSFTGGSDGANPTWGLSLAPGGFYGTTHNGGADGTGTVFDISPSGSTWTLTTLYSFTFGTDGTYPYAGVTVGSDQNLYGTTEYGGTYNEGAIWEIGPLGESILYSFGSVPNDGINPLGGLSLDNYNNFWGDTSAGGFDGDGVIYEIPYGSTTPTIVHSLTFDEGADPQGNLILADDGGIYGTAEYGGGGANGSIFRIAPGTDKLTSLYWFTGNTDGSSPYGALVQGIDGQLYGTTGAGALGSYPGNGTIFRMTLAGKLTTLYQFTGGTDGSSPLTGLTLGTDGNFYGVTTSGGGTGGHGAFFQWNMEPVTTASLSGALGSSGWYTSAVLVTLTAVDSYEPIAATVCSVDGGPEEGYVGSFTVSGDQKHTVTYYSEDIWGDTEPTNTLTIDIDATPPSTTASLTGSTVTLTATDATSGVATTYYTVDGGAQQTYTAPFAVSAPGSHSVLYWSVDVAGNVETAHSLTVNNTPPPATPMGLAATPGNARVSLSWSSSTGATAYNIYRSLTSGGEGSTPYQTVTTLNYTDTGLTNGTPYYYTVAAVNAGGTSAQSGEAEATPNVAPTFSGEHAWDDGVNFYYEVDYSGIYAHFQAFLDTDNNAATGYTTRGIGADYMIQDNYLYRSTANGSSWSWTVVGAATVTFPSSGVVLFSVPLTEIGAPTSARVAYTERDVEWSTVNDPHVVIYTESGILTTPANLTATFGNAQVALAWTGSAEATSYNIYRSTTSGGEGSTPYATSSTTSFADTSVSNGTTYYYKVAAVNAGGTSAQSTEASATPNVAPAFSGEHAWDDGTYFYYEADYTGSYPNFQLFLDTDDNAATGYTTRGIGADYMIQDNYLYRSTANGSSWSWNSVSTASMTFPSAGVVEFQVLLSAIGSPSTAQVALTARDAAWNGVNDPNVKTFVK